MGTGIIRNLGAGNRKPAKIPGPKTTPCIETRKRPHPEPPRNESRHNQQEDPNGLMFDDAI
ncbi:hypothetical protein MGG_15697 [Pyricularia oryzae 70-15]|uniref:Uncharacterized protein n=3 Tax=Pyricularia oryzae TaxID=318829 RepID=G4MSG6_PYRO7|nr:uncharacterized protein MGG_15697 [Pyricularia oryzae 70-15]EHA54582.1 hypothetical protein MGG_15697 [Pyricularia oryzae 70-15]ELQ37545.1 hypothetical protein OOU_Y34scaffold00590g59 [Pyricularia oryzae Y34]